MQAGLRRHRPREGRVPLRRATTSTTSRQCSTSDGRATARRRLPRPQGRRPAPPESRRCCRRARRSSVQVAKEPIGTKGARITSPRLDRGAPPRADAVVERVGVSRRIDSDRERRRLREIVDARRGRSDLGFIIRTAGEGTREADLEADVALPRRRCGRRSSCARTGARAPPCSTSELSLPLRAIRDFVEPAHAADRRRRSRPVYEKMKELRSTRFVADPKPRLELYEDARCRSSTSSASRSRIDANLGTQGLAQVGRLPDRRPERGAHRDRREHGPLRRQARSRGDGPQDQPRGGAGGRAPAPLPQHRRPDHHRPDRHGDARRTARRSTARSRKRCAATRRRRTSSRSPSSGSSR